MTPKQLVQLIKRDSIEFIDLRFMDFPGRWQHKMYEAVDLNEDKLADGLGFDGSCIRGWSAINEADMLLVPVLDTARVDPFYDRPTLSMIADIKDPVTRKEFSRDPRSVARKAQRYMKTTKIADAAMFSPEMEFFVFDNVSYDQTVNAATYRVDSSEGMWNRGNDDPTNLGNQIRLREGYFPVPPIDTLGNLRNEMVDVLKQMGIPVVSHHHEVATGGQCEIDLAHLDLVAMADVCMMYKYVVKNVAARHGKVVTFMPKPLYQDNGSGMHTHFSLWKSGKPLMSGRHYAGLSQLGLYAVGGILRHAPALLAFTNPTTNSYKRLVHGYEAPVYLTYSSRSRASAVRVPVYHNTPETKRVEIRFPDCSANPYLAFAALLMAALDGVRHKIDPGDPLDRDMTDLTEDEILDLSTTPANLDEALDALAADHDFLLAGDVFNSDLIRFWIKYKREIEAAELHSRPHPYEFCMYFDI
ncbi:MAG: type I glutamate--ammonia ligase [Planctomycetaceae bacterium]|nr:type I glutamate--ammonia ligase [Planctomycetaceae bacterium]